MRSRRRIALTKPAPVALHGPGALPRRGDRIAPDGLRNPCQMRRAHSLRLLETLILAPESRRAVPGIGIETRPEGGWIFDHIGAEIAPQKERVGVQFVRTPKARRWQ